MISFRTHVVTLVTVLFALAIGVVLGGGPLSEVGRGALTSAPTQAAARDDARVATYADTFAAASAPTLYGDGLDGRAVALVRLPGADDRVVTALTDQVETAGGAVSATYAVEPALLDAADKSLVDTLGTQLLEQLEAGAVDEAAPTYERIGQLLGLAIASGAPAGGAPDQDALAVRQSLTGAELVTQPQGAGGEDAEPRRAPLVLVVLGDDADDTILSGVLAGLAQQAVGVVTAGETGARDLPALRTAPVAGDVTTVDGIDTALGRVTTVLALIRALKTPGGAFGAAGSDGAVPLG